MAKPSRERREFERSQLACPITIRDGGGSILYKSRMENISDGGAYLVVPTDALLSRGCEVDISFSVPRTTPNTYMLEDFACKAKVVRHQRLTEGDRRGMALQFDKPKQLVLEV